ncbi:hypothetical protein BY996DRAFT_6430068 [Phakopsora pachyrhizi]|uniref:Post-SET domain-containing protein n=1 Tax=Phakopsora pachyrhizi TaxID=170000 RepID=A0AAV0BF77_PHAPC|nr:hypothetical protein BY996DRAFT_6430068 [Phakopsora pachyrhizi]CAH7685822.1 hypothetical protein PPACK8108_LOCUS20405 [Phakopsora pachyrhizi]
MTISVNFLYPDLFRLVRGPEGNYSSALIANKDFKAGSVLAVLGEECQLTNAKEYTSVQVSEEDPENDQISHIDLGSELVYINHGCDPNVKFDLPDGLLGFRESRWKLVALKDIKENDPLSFAYFSTEWDMKQPFDCTCGSKRCLGKIKGAKHIPAEILDRYFINDHIKRAKAMQNSK